MLLKPYTGVLSPYLNRMIDDQINRTERVDFSRISAKNLDGVAHGSEVDNGRNAGEVLKDVAGV